MQIDFQDLHFPSDPVTRTVEQRYFDETSMIHGRKLHIFFLQLLQLLRITKCAFSSR